MDKTILRSVGGHVLVIFMPRFVRPNTNPHRHWRVWLAYIIIVHTRYTCVKSEFKFSRRFCPFGCGYIFDTWYIDTFDTCWHWTKITNWRCNLQQKEFEGTRILVDDLHVIPLILAHTQAKGHHLLIALKSSKIPHSENEINLQFSFVFFFAALLHRFGALVDLSWTEFEDKSLASRQWIQFA